MRAKKKLTKLWSILLVLVMLVGLLPTTALAEGATPAPATTTATTTADFTSGDGSAALALLNAAKTDGAADSVWKSDTKTLTLNGINFTTTAAIAVKLPHGSTIVLPDGTTNIIKSENSNNSTQSCGIYLEEDVSGNIGDLTIKIPDGSDGTGKLTVTGGAAREYSQGIRSGSGKVTISGGIVEATGGTAELGSEGILAQQGLAISGNAKVTAIGGSGSANSYGIYGSGRESKVEISDNADVTAISAAASNNSYGIYIYLAVNITGGTVKCSAGAASYSYGIYGNQAVNITGGTVKVSAGAASRSYGIFSINNVKIDSAEVTATGKHNAIQSYDGSLTTSNVKNISFDANGGAGAMQAYTNNTTYTLPANGFTAPDGKQFNGWKVGSENKVVGDSITVSENITVTALWKADEYNVTVTGGKATVGTGTDAISKAEVGATVTLTADPAPSGQVFDKWEVVSGGITLANANNATTTFTMPAGAVSVKATYHTHSYGSEWKTDANKHWHECACSAKSAEAAHTAGDWIIDTPATATTAGTKHKACTVCGYEMESSTIPATGYTVSFDANGGSVTPASAVTGADGKLTSLPTPTRSGYTFNGWYTATSGGTKVDTNYVFSAYTTIYAQWTSTGGGSTTYTVSFDANGGSGTMADVTGVSGEYTLPANGFTAPAGKQFKGWATTSGGAVISGTTINVTANTTLYAIWEAIPVTTYTITFDANGGTCDTSTLTTDAEGKLTSLPTPTRSGYTFNGWYTATSGGTKVDTNYVFAADTTIYAQWTSTGGGSYTYTVSFDANGGSGTMADVTGVSGEYTLPANGFTAPAGQQFKAWSVGSIEKAVGAAITVTSNTTVTAVWEDIPVTTYTITFNANGGSVTPTTATTAADGKLTSLPTPTRSGRYSFNGWYTAANGGTKVDTNYVFAADTTIYAQWTSTGGGSSGSSSGSSGSTITVPVSDPKNQVKVTASVSGSTATVQKIDLSKIDQAQGVTIDFTGLGRTIESAKLPTSAIKEIGATEGGTLTVKLTAGNVTFDTAALKAVADQAGSQITLTLTPVKTSALNASQKETVGDAPVFDLRLLGGSKAITNFKGGNVTVTLPHTLSKGQEPAGVVVYYLSNDGNPEACKTTYDTKNKLVTFTTTHFSLYFVGYEQPAAEWKNPFTDVAEGAWYFDSVKYVHSEGMMVGTSATKFSPDATTTRGMVVTILYRLEGEPAVSSTSSFNDVAEGKYYANAVKWAAENEIVGGYGNGQFGPEDPITREQMAAILYRYATFKGLNMTKTADLSKFTDNGKISDWSKAALNWANAERLISGKSGGVLDPLGTATRAEVAAMLMRYCELEK